MKKMILLAAVILSGFIVPATTEAAAPICTGTVFNDVTAGLVGAAFCGYIEEFSDLGITAGCGGGNFCPNDNVTRAQMAVFLVRAFEL